jgi:hypothetical protein
VDLPSRIDEVDFARRVAAIRQLLGDAYQDRIPQEIRKLRSSMEREATEQTKADKRANGHKDFK